MKLYKRNFNFHKLPILYNMTNIDQKVFDENLRLTKAYCDLQLRQYAEKNPAEILRSINPIYDGQPIFSFGFRSYFETQWAFDPLTNGNREAFNDLYQRQLIQKKETFTEEQPGKKHFGRILVAEVNEMPLDGVSEEETEGFVDIFDCPPVDTWFYYLINNEYRVLFAWIPERFVELVDNASLVNYSEALYWYDKSNWGDVMYNK